MFADISKNIAISTLEMVHQAKTSHIGSCLSMIDILTVLYSFIDVEKIKKEQHDRDRVFISKGHAAAAVYATLSEFGVINHSELETFCKNGSRLQAHVSHKVPGIELSTGSLGHALSVATGCALTAKKDNLKSHYYAILSDGELNEGSNWEAIMFAAHHKLENLVVFIDYNKIQSFGRIEEVINLEPLSSKFTAFNWDVLNVNGHDQIELFNALQQKTKRPKVIICNTVKGKGVEFMEDKLEWHYKSPNSEQLKVAISGLLNA